jgi:uncharacterized damage-inducible protein DinB
MTIRIARSLLSGVGAIVTIAGHLSAQPEPSGADRPVAAALESLWSETIRHITTVAQETSEADYGWRPTEGVRSIGEMIGHIAGAQYLICAAALGDTPRDEDEVERNATTRAALLEALTASTAYCARAYAQSDSTLHAETEVFGRTGPRFYALGVNATHNGEHYGNLVTYLRLRGLVPPSSRPRQP